MSPKAENTRIEDSERKARERLQDLHGLLARHPEAAHRVMEAMLGGPLKFTAREGRYWIEGQVGASWLVLIEGAR